MNYKNEEKLEIPEWFSLASYAPLKHFMTPLPWLEQFALRIDLMSHWKEAIHKNPDCEAYHWLGSVDENYPEDLLLDVLKSPLPSIGHFVDRLPYVDFPTVALVRNCAESVRQMTALDFVTASMMVSPTTRGRMGVLAPGLWDSFVHGVYDRVDPNQMQESQAVRDNESDGPKDCGTYPKHLLELWLMVQTTGGIETWMMEPFLNPHENNGVAYFSVNTSVPYPDAERAFHQRFIQAQERKCKSSKMDSSTFAKWCDDGVLPYIDLNIYEAVQRFRENKEMSITEEEMASAIYPDLPAVPQRSSTCVSDTTRPVAEDLQNPFSPRFRLLLTRAAEYRQTCV